VDAVQSSERSASKGRPEGPILTSYHYRKNPAAKCSSSLIGLTSGPATASSEAPAAAAQEPDIDARRARRLELHGLVERECPTKNIVEGNGKRSETDNRTGEVPKSDKFSLMIPHQA
jgi:hypothetical protein